MENGTRSGALWAIVLAAGDGTRLAAVTRSLHGRETPKQFAALTSDRTLLQMTMDRMAPVVPPHRTVVVVGEAQRALADAQLGEYAGVEVISQPRNVGTAVGVLLPLAHVLARDPEARVTVFPSDHHVRRRGPFLDAIRRATLAAEQAPGGVALVGAAAESAATDLGWIVRARPLGPAALHASTVARFIEKPSEPTAMRLLQSGALWNTLVIAARARALWNLAQRQMPESAGAFRHYRHAIGQRHAAELLRDLYTRLPSSDLSRDVLERARDLAVVAAIDAGWSDCGTPERLLRCLEEDGRAARLREHLDRVHRSIAPSPAAA